MIRPIKKIRQTMRQQGNRDHRLCHLHLCWHLLALLWLPWCCLLVNLFNTAYSTIRPRLYGQKLRMNTRLKAQMNRKITQLLSGSGLSMRNLRMRLL